MEVHRIMARTAYCKHTMISKATNFRYLLVSNFGGLIVLYKKTGYRKLSEEPNFSTNNGQG